MNRQTNQQSDKNDRQGDIPTTISFQKRSVGFQCFHVGRIGVLILLNWRQTRSTRRQLDVVFPKGACCHVPSRAVACSLFYVTRKILRFADHLSFFSHQTRSSTSESQCCGSFFIFFTRLPVGKHTGSAVDHPITNEN